MTDIRCAAFEEEGDLLVFAPAEYGYHSKHGSNLLGLNPEAGSIRGPSLLSGLPKTSQDVADSGPPAASAGGPAESNVPQALVATEDSDDEPVNQTHSRASGDLLCGRDFWKSIYATY